MEEGQLLAGLNPEQRQAVKHLDGPALVLAGPGSGKTRVITRRLAYLMTQGVYPSQILAVTFTNKAAREMQTRVRELVGQSSLYVTTFHSYCARLLRRHAPLVGLRENFSIWDRDESLSLIKQVAKQHNLSSFDLRPAQLLESIAGLKRSLIAYDEYPIVRSTSYDPVVADIYRDYQSRLQIANAVDFDDLLFYAARMLRDHDELRRQLDQQFRYVMVDEYQDTNEAQFMIVRLLCHDYQNLMVTGDPDQSIYGWRGATIRNILDFKKYYPQAVQIRLEQNYRSTAVILQVADAIIQENSQRLHKTLRTDREHGRPVRVICFPTADDEAEGVAETIAAGMANGRRPRDFAVLYRANHLSRRLEQSIRRRGIPYQVVRGTEFYQRKEVKDLLAYLQLIHNPDNDEALKRVINVPARSIGKVTVTRLAAFAMAERISLWEAVQRADEIPSLGKRAKGLLAKFAALMQELIRSPADSVSALLDSIVEATQYQTIECDVSTPQGMVASGNVDELRVDAREFDMEFAAEPTDSTALEAFLQRVALVSDQDRMSAGEDAVSLMTLHAAKGLEFPVVFIVGLEDGLLPHARSMSGNRQIGLEEERRLFFVGVTRAKDELHLSCAALRAGAAPERRTVVSQFLVNLPREGVERHGFGNARSHLAVDEDHEFDQSIPEMAPEAPPASPKPHSALRAQLVTASSLQKPVRKASQRGSTDDSLRLTTGDLVSHPQYGVGKVVECGGAGRNATARVQFGDETEARRFRVAFAPLTLLKAAPREE